MGLTEHLGNSSRDKERGRREISRRPLETMIFLELSLQEGPPRAAGTLIWRWKYLEVGTVAVGAMAEVQASHMPVAAFRPDTAARGARSTAGSASISCVVVVQMSICRVLESWVGWWWSRGPAAEFVGRVTGVAE